MREAEPVKHGMVILLAVLLAAAPGCGDGGPGTDTTPPAVPRGVVATVTGDLAKVFWTPNSESDFSHYLLYMGTRTDSLADIGEELTLTSKFIPDLTPGVTYYFAVSAVDEAGNESDRSSSVQVTATSTAHSTSLGWSDFTAGEYLDALGHFRAATNLDDDHAEAWLGAGWSLLFIDEPAIARIDLLAAIAKGWTGVEADAGLALAYRALPDYLSAINHALAVVTADSDWIFSHMTSIDWRDMRLLLAQCYFNRGEEWFDEAQAQVDLLDPGNGLDPGVPGSWTVGGTTYYTYGAALMTAIMALEAVISG